MTDPRLLPHLRPDFAWGVSTSSFQIEGATTADGRGPSVWDVYGQRGEIRNGDTGDVACDHYHRYREDVALMARLGITAYRFSVAWPRLLPAGQGAVNAAGLAFYDRLLDALAEAGITPWLCLYHWDLPQALEERGGWLNRESVDWFAGYARLVGRHFGGRVKRFATFNEPSIFTLFSRSYGVRDRAAEDKFHRAIHHVNLAHGAAVDALRDTVPGALIGGIHSRQPCRPSGDGAADAAAAARLDAYWNDAFPDPQGNGIYPDALAKGIAPHLLPGDMGRIRRPLDWFGVNHYSPVYVRAAEGAMLGYDFGDKPAGTTLTPIDWPIEPEAFTTVLATAHARYGLPIYVMENGFGSNAEPARLDGALRDDGRIAYLDGYLAALQRAVQQGADVRGYFVWSLLDNLEWDFGYSHRFGLVHVDFATQQRTPKASFDWYRAVIAAARRRPNHG
jgi:beta-glucosidase